MTSFSKCLHSDIWSLSYALIPLLSMVAVSGWLCRLNILMKTRERDSQRCEGDGRGWESRALQRSRQRSSSCWELHSKASIQWIVITEEGRFVVSGLILACVMDVFNWFLNLLFRPLHCLVQLDSSSNGMFFSLLNERYGIWIYKYTPYIQIQS